MRTSLIVPLALAVAMGLSNAAVAQVDLLNQDEATYEVTVHEGQDTSTFVLGPGAKESDLCDARCTITVKDVGEITAEGNEIVRIQGGEIVKER